MKNKIKWLLRASFILIFICSISLIYKWHYDYFTSAPSDHWAKEVLVADSADVEKSKVVRYGEGSVVIYNEKENIKISLLDKVGKVLKNTTIKTEDDFILDMNVFTDGKNIYTSWIKSTAGEKYMQSYVLDSNLSQINKNIDKGVQYSKNLDEINMLVGYKDKIVIKNIKDNKTSEIKLASDMASGIKTKDGYLIASLYDEQLSYTQIKNGKVDIKKDIAKFSKNGQTSISDMAMNTDGKLIYVLVETKVMSNYGKMIKLTYDLNTGKVDRGDLELDDKSTFYNPVPVQSEDGARFLLVTDKQSKVEQKAESQVVDLTFKDNIPQELIKVTRTVGYVQYPSISRDTVSFISINDTKKRIYITANNEEFKKVNNVERSEEKYDSRGYTVSKGFVSVLHGLMGGVKWIGLGAILMAIMSLVLVDKYHDKFKIPFFIGSYVTVAIVKIIFIYDAVYKIPGADLPQALLNSSVGMGITILTSVLSGTFSYIKYSKDLEQMPILSFMEGLLIDTVLTALLFIPYI